MLEVFPNLKKKSGKCGPKFEIDEAEIGQNCNFDAPDDFGRTLFELQIQDFRKNLTVDRGDRMLSNGGKIPES